MNNILIELFIAYTNKTFSLYIPCDCKLSTIINMIEAIIIKYQSNLYLPGNDSVLCWFDSGDILNINLTPDQLGILNGTRLLLM